MRESDEKRELTEDELEGVDGGRVYPHSYLTEVLGGTSSKSGIPDEGDRGVILPEDWESKVHW